jgi:hypothetical protein
MDQEIEAGVALVTTAMRDAELPAFEIAGSQMVGAAIGADAFDALCRGLETVACGRAPHKLPEGTTGTWP